jgi:hypothetical protein
VQGFPVDPWLYLVMIIGGAMMLWVRSGRSIPVIHPKRSPMLKKYRV